MSALTKFSVTVSSGAPCCTATPSAAAGGSCVPAAPLASSSSAAATTLIHTPRDRIGLPSLNRSLALRIHRDRNGHPAALDLGSERPLQPLLLNDPRHIGLARHRLAIHRTDH